MGKIANVHAGAIVSERKRMFENVGKRIREDAFLNDFFMVLRPLASLLPTKFNRESDSQC